MSFFVLLTTLVTWGSTIAFCQQNKLTMFAYADTGLAISIQQPLTIDSTLAVNDGAAFHPSEPQIIYSTTANGRTSIHSFHWGKKIKSTILENDYVITNVACTPDNKWISFREIRGNTSSLIKVSFDGKQKVVIAEHFPYENYLWIDDNSLLAIERGEQHVLNLVSLRPRKQVPVVVHVGNTLSKATPDGPFGFIHKLSIDTWAIKELSRDGSINFRLNTLADAEVFSMTPGGKYLAASGNELFFSGNKGNWNRITEVAESGITAIFMNFQGDRLALITTAQHPN